jgi:glycosyltransferase involved in cell wall biosynthesis
VPLAAEQSPIRRTEPDLTGEGGTRGRILMVIRPSKGGAFGHALRLSEQLAMRGYECAICGPHNQPAGDRAPRVFHLEIPRYPHPVRHAAAVARLGRIYRRFKPHVVHAHGSQGGVIARLARFSRPRMPVVLTPHNYAFTNYFTSRLDRGLYRSIEVALAPLATRVICVCEAERRVAASIGPSKRTRLVYNGIEPLSPAPADPEIAHLSETGPLICAVAELQPAKGVTTLIAAMPVVLERFPDANLAVAGEGIERQRLERQMIDLGVAERVHLLGSINNIAGLLGVANVLVQPSWSESFPYSMLEAMGMGMPIVATDVGGVGEAIEDQVTGCLVPAKDSAALAQATVDLLADPDRADALGNAARSRMLSQFRLDTMVDETLRVYREIGLR